MNKSSPAGRRYLKRFIPTMITYVVLIFGASFALRALEIAGPLAWVIAAAPGIPVVAVLAIVGLYLKEETDEFQRNVQAEAMIWGIGLTLSGTTVWGLLEFYVEAPRLPVFWAFPIFFFTMGLAQVFVRRRYR